MEKTGKVGKVALTADTGGGEREKGGKFRGKRVIF